MARTNAASAQRNGRGRFAKGIVQMRLDQEAAQLFARFNSYSEMARQLNIPLSTAYDRVQRALKAEPDNDTASAKKVALARLDAMAKIAQQVAEEEHVARSNGRVIFVKDEAGEPVPLHDRLPNLQALDRLARIEDQRNRLLGTYAPTAARLEVVPSELVEELVRRNEEQIAALEKDLGLPPGGDISDAQATETPTESRKGTRR
jgi:hypothetical protein